MLIGEKDSGMFLHKDTLHTASWQAQFSGEKRWHLCGPSEDSFMYKAGDVDAFSPDYGRFPLFREASCLQVTVSPGDVIYYPKDWWHQTQNLVSPTISVTGTLVSRGNYASVREELVNNCEGRGGTFRPDAELCTALEQCYKTWDRTFAS
jgi:histone arginine demethylase JMJD6